MTDTIPPRTQDDIWLAEAQRRRSYYETPKGRRDVEAMHAIECRVLGEEIHRHRRGLIDLLSSLDRSEYRASHVKVAEACEALAEATGAMDRG